MLIGDKIKSLRQRAGLSQSQLAGSDITQAYISLIEGNKVIPSEKVLQCLSKRLQCSVELFKETGFNSADITSLMQLTGRYINEASIDKAMTLICKGIQLCESLDLPEQKFAFNIKLGVCLQRSGKLEEALEVLEQAFIYFIHDQSIEQIVAVSHELGNTYFHLEQYAISSYYYKKCFNLSSNRKKLSEIYFTSKLYYATCLYRQGNLEECREAFQELFDFSKKMNQFKNMINAGLGLGWAHYELGDLNEALMVTKNIHEISKKFHPELTISILHNLSIYLYERGSLTESDILWKHCYNSYLNQNKVRHLVKLIEEKWARLLKTGEIDNAEMWIQEALNLMADNDESTLRGKAYRALGACHQARGDFSTSKHFYQLAIGYFQKVREGREMELTKRLLKEIESTEM